MGFLIIVHPQEGIGTFKKEVDVQSFLYGEMSKKTAKYGDDIRLKPKCEEKSLSRGESPTPVQCSHC